MTLTVFVALATLYIDFSFDGPWYHLPVSQALAHGSNVFFMPTGAFWGDAYPKIAEIFVGEIFKVLPNINASILLHLALAVGVFAYTLYFGVQIGATMLQSLLSAILLLLHPLFIQQLYTAYVDYVLCSCCLFIMLSMILILKKDELLDKLVFIFSSSIAIAVKMSGVLYPAVAFLIFFGVGLYQKNFFKSLKKYVVLGSCVLIFGIRIFGFNPYVTNLAEGRHIFHPLKGDEAVPDIMPLQTPANYVHKNRISKLLHSLMGQSKNIHQSIGSARSKAVPGTIKYEELRIAGAIDLRVAGWGPFFAFILLLSCSLPILFSMKKNHWA